MSGRGKGGKGLGKGRKETEYAWKTNEEVAVVTFISSNEAEFAGMFVPMTKVHPLVKMAIDGVEKYDGSRARFEWTAGDEDSFETLFEMLNGKAVRRILDIESDGDEDEDEGEDEEPSSKRRKRGEDAEPDEDFEKDVVMEAVSEWFATLSQWRKPPPVPVMIKASASLMEEA